MPTHGMCGSTLTENQLKMSESESQKTSRPTDEPEMPMPFGENNNNFDASAHRNVMNLVRGDEVKELPIAWLNRLLPSTDQTINVDWQDVFGRVYFIDDHGVFRPLDLERAIAGEMSHFDQLIHLPYNVGEILQQFTTLPFSLIHHYATFGTYLQALFRSSKLVDVLIHVQDKVFAAHRIVLACYSMYFARAFLSNKHHMGRIAELRLRNIHPDDFITVVSFMYTGQLYVNTENINDLMNVANQLQISAVLFKCLEYLGDMPLNRTGMETEEPTPETIDEQAQTLLSSHLSDIMRSNVFLQMGIEPVELALGHDDVLVDKEMDVFNAAMEWITYDLKARRKYLERLIKQVRFVCMPSAEVVTASQNNDLLRTSPYCRNRVMESIWLMTLKGYGSYDMLGCLSCKPRNCLLPVEEGPVKREWSYSETPLVRQVSNGESPLQRQWSYKETPLSRQASYEEQPLQRYASYEEVPLQKQASYVEQPLQRQPSRQWSYAETPLQQQASTTEQPLQKQTSYIEQPLQRQPSYKESPPQQRASKTASQLQRQVSYADPPLQHMWSYTEMSPQTSVELPLQHEASSAKLPLQREWSYTQTPPQQSPLERQASIPHAPKTKTCLQLETVKEEPELPLPEPPLSPYIKVFSSHVDTEETKGPVIEIEVGLQRSSGSSSTISSRHGGSHRCTSGRNSIVIEKSAAGAGASCLGGGDILAIGGYFDQDDMKSSSHGLILDSGQGDWESMSEMPETRVHFAAAFLKGRVYVTGGYDPCANVSRAQATDDTFIFDPVHEKWERGGAMLFSRSFHTVCVLDGRLYAMGGQNEDEELLKTVEVYDPVADHWTAVSPMTYVRVGACSAVLKGDIVVAGGYGQMLEPTCDCCAILSSSECFHPDTNKWQSGSRLRLPRAQACLVSMEPYLYLCGGVTRHTLTDLLVSVSDVDRYDPDTDQWTHLTDLCTPRHNAGAAALGNKLYVVGGVSTEVREVLRSVECYNTDTDTWDIGLPLLPRGARSFACVVTSIT